jgi:hypothetical protein
MAGSFKPCDWDMELRDAEVREWLGALALIARMPERCVITERAM